MASCNALGRVQWKALCRLPFLAGRVSKGQHPLTGECGEGSVEFASGFVYNSSEGARSCSHRPESVVRLREIGEPGALAPGFCAFHPGANAPGSPENHSISRSRSREGLE